MFDTVFEVVSPLKMTKIFPNSRGGLDNGDFLFSKILIFFTKWITRELFDYYGIAPKEKTQKIIRSSSF